MRKKIIKKLINYEANIEQENEDRYSLKMILKSFHNINFYEEFKSDKKEITEYDLFREDLLSTKLNSKNNTNEIIPESKKKEKNDDDDESIMQKSILNQNENNIKSQISDNSDDENDLKTTQKNIDNNKKKSDLEFQNSSNESDLESIINFENFSNDTISKDSKLIKYINQCDIENGKIVSLDLQNLNINLINYISMKTHDNLLNISKNSICYIEKEHGKGGGTGFFIKLSIPSEQKPLYGLITNNHVLNIDYFKNNNSIKINSEENRNHFVINLNNDIFIFSSELIDITFIQLPDDISSKVPDIVFLDPCDDDYNYEKDQYIYIFQYPKKKLKFSTGLIKSSSGFNYFHLVTTKNGSSGSPLLNSSMKIVGVHKTGKINKHGNINIATKMSIVKYAISILYYKSYTNKITKARESVRKLSEDEEDELINHDLNKTKIPNMYVCSYSTSPLYLLFYRTNHGWYFTSRNKKEIKNIISIYKRKMKVINDTSENNKEIIDEIQEIKYFNWIFINPFKKLEDIIKEFDEELDHLHKLIISWLKISEFMYI
jgi:V8-like Glu-specific endopeptidase